MGIWIFNTPEPCCNPVTAPGNEPGRRKNVPGLNFRCGDCRCVPAKWKLSVPAGTVLAPILEAQALNGVHILSRVGQDNPDLLPIQCLWEVSIPFPGSQSIEFFAGWELSFGLEKGLETIWTIGTLPIGGTPGPIQNSVPTHSIFALHQPFFHCLGPNTFRSLPLRTIDRLTIDPTKQLTIEPWYP